MIPVAILAGGLATRLLPVTRSTPKSMVTIAGQPFVAHQLELMRAQGVQRVVLCLGHLGELVQQFVGDGTRWGLSVEYSWEKDHLLGTGGALKRATDILGERFFVLYGDSYLQADYRSVESAHMDSGRIGLMTVFRNSDAWDHSNVEYARGRICRYDKVERTPAMQHIDWGLGVLRAEAFAGFANGDVFDLALVYRRLLERDELAGFEVYQRFYEIGSQEGIRETEAHLLSKRANQEARRG